MSHAQHGHHVTPKALLYKVFGALVGLTILTALTAQLDLGAMNVPLALAIAGSKAALVVMFFMALKYDNKVNTLAFVVGTVFVAVFVVFTLFDTAFRGDLGNVGTETISDIERREETLRAREAALGNGQAGAPGDTTAADTTLVDTTPADPTASGEGTEPTDNPDEENSSESPDGAGEEQPQAP